MGELYKYQSGGGAQTTKFMRRRGSRTLQHSRVKSGQERQILQIKETYESMAKL